MTTVLVSFFFQRGVLEAFGPGDLENLGRFLLFMLFSECSWNESDDTFMFSMVLLVRTLGGLEPEILKMTAVSFF